MILLELSTTVTLLLSFFVGGNCDSLNKERDTAQDIDVLFREFWEWKLVNNPEFATGIGIYKYDDRVNEMSISSFKRRASDVSLFLNKLIKLKSSIAGEKTSERATNMELLESDLRQYLSGMKFNTYVWPLNVLEGPQSGPAYVLNVMRKNTVGDFTSILRRILLFSQQLDEHITLLTEGIRIGQSMHRKAFEKLIPIYKKMGAGEVENHPFFKPFQVQPKSISNDTWQYVLKNAKHAIKTYTQPSYRRLAHFLHETYLPKSRPSVGISTVPNGQEYYQALLTYHTTTNLSPQQVHNIGLHEVNRITSRMEAIKNVVKFNGTLNQFRQFLRTSKKFGFKSEEDMLNHYKSIRTKVAKILPKYFGLLPKSRFVIKPVPADLAPSAPMAYYSEPSPNGKPGTFYLNTYKPQSRRTYVAEPLFLHEAVPGHHLQISLNIEHGSPVLFRRFSGMDMPLYQAPASFAMNTAYVEGWGLYAEYLGEEMEMYKDPYVLFGRLSEEMTRAGRLVVDTGMHALGWDRAKAIDFMRTNTADDLNNIVAEIDRYIAVPGQACAYKIGELKIKELRKMAEHRLRKKFDIRKFHDFLLSMGSIPLTVLEKQMKRFVEREMH